MLRLDKRCEFVPISYPSSHNVKIAFKKFLRASCPSWPLNDDQSASFLKQLDESSWLQMVTTYLMHFYLAVLFVNRLIILERGT